MEQSSISSHIRYATAGTPNRTVIHWVFARRFSSGTPKIRVADCRYNAEQVFTLMRQAAQQGVRVLVLPELCLTGCTCGDLFAHDTLLKGAEEALATVLEATKHLDLLTALGMPVRGARCGRLGSRST